jgi:AAA-like domain
MRLLAAYAMHLMGGDKARHKVMGFDEAWFLLEDAPGRRLIEHLNRWGRSEFATPILVTHLISDAEELDNLIGARFMFGFESDAEAQAALRVLRLDQHDDRLRQRLLAYREGRCLLRDLDGRVGAIRIEPPPDLLAALRTTPVEHDDRYDAIEEAA